MIDAFFKILNFGLFIALLVYYWRRSLRKIFQGQLVRKRAKVENVAREEEVAVTQEAVLREKMDAQAVLYAVLTDKVQQWKQGQLREEIAMQEVYDRCAQELKERIVREVEAYHNSQFKKNLADQAFKESWQELKQIFAEQQQAQAYNKAALEAFEKQRRV